MTRYAIAKFKLSATIGDIEFDDICMFTSDFEGNAIPKASIMVPVGRGFKGNESKTAVIHKAVKQLKVQMPAKVTFQYVHVDSSPGDKEKMPKGEKVIFDGYAVGTGWRRGESGAQFVIYLLHWLSDLAYSSSLSHTSHPGNNADFGYDAAHVSISDCAGAGALEPHWTAMTGGNKVINSGNITADLWGKVLQPWMVCVASQDRINSIDLAGGKVNDSAKKALERIAPLFANPCHVASGVELKGAEPDAIANSMSDALHLEMFGSWANTTLWDKLVGEWCPSYFLSLVPRVSDALVIPFTPGLREAYKTIKGSEYNFTSLESTMPIVPRAVGIMGGYKSYSGVQNGGFDKVEGRTGGLAGYYEPGGSPTGLVILKDSPRWLVDTVQARRHSRASTGAEGKIVATASNPGEGEAGPAELQKGSYTPLIDAYAHQWFIVEMLKGRHGELSGKLRFDIAPFSTVKVEAVGEKHVEGDNLKEPFFGTVLRVSTQIDAERTAAGTAFSIAHNRSEGENEDERTSIDKPPFYKESFKGCSLVDGFE